MSRPIVLAPSTRFRIKYFAGELRDIVAPFIDHVSERVAVTGNLEKSVSTAATVFPESARFFVIEPGRIDETFGLAPQYLFADYSIRELMIATAKSAYRLELRKYEDLAELKVLLELCSCGRHTETAIRSKLNDHGRALLAWLLEIGCLIEEERSLPAFAPAGTPGVYRLQHASLLYQTEAVGILVDPHLHSIYRPSGIRSDIYKDFMGHKVDVILISHFHEDHFFLSTLLMFPKDTPIVVPKVPKSTIICTDMVKLLRQVGFENVIAADWYSDPLRFGDAEVHILPFYGEQPLRFEVAPDPALRNWGNTYVIRTNHYTSWFLIDSGNDVLGSMKQVADHVRRKIDRVDILLSNLRRFHIYSPTYINGGLNWLTLSPRQMRDFRSMKSHCITLGPGGVAEICKTVGAQHYLPYAHWWGELGCIAESSQDTPGQGERGLLDELSRSIEHFGAKTGIVPWHIGDGFVSCGGGRFRHVPIRNTQ